MSCNHRFQRDGASAGLNSLLTKAVNGQNAAARHKASTLSRTGANVRELDRPLGTMASTTWLSRRCKNLDFMFCQRRALHFTADRKALSSSRLMCSGGPFHGHYKTTFQAHHEEGIGCLGNRFGERNSPVVSRTSLPLKTDLRLMHRMMDRANPPPCNDCCSEDFD